MRSGFDCLRGRTEQLFCPQRRCRPFWLGRVPEYTPVAKKRGSLLRTKLAYSVRPRKQQQPQRFAFAAYRRRRTNVLASEFLILAVNIYPLVKGEAVRKTPVKPLQSIGGRRHAQTIKDSTQYAVLPVYLHVIAQKKRLQRFTLWAVRRTFRKIAVNGIRWGSPLEGLRVGIPVLTLGTWCR